MDPTIKQYRKEEEKMTLFRQIALLISMILLILFLLISMDTFHQSSKYLNGQLRTTAQDTATVLSIAISSINQEDQQVKEGNLDSLFSAVFDSGYYSNIRLISDEGKTIYEKKRKLNIQGIPNWFINFFSLEKATGTAQVMQGWVSLGRLEVTLHPGFAYANIFHNLKATLLWFVSLFLVILILLWYLLHITLKPLKEMYVQANAIHDNQFIQQARLPKTRELRRVVQAVNRMISKVQSVFENEERTLKSYHELLYTDTLTGLYNRRYILSQLEQTLSEESSFQGSMVIIKINKLDSVREYQGYTDADNIVKVFANITQQIIDEGLGERVARMSDDEFAFIFSVDHVSSEEKVEMIFDTFKDHMKKSDFNYKVSLSAGIVNLVNSSKLGEVLAELDLSLTRAQMQGGYHYFVSQPTHLVLPKGKMQWRNWFQDMLTQQKFYLVKQPVFDKNKQLIQREVFVRINDDKGALIPAAVFMPMALALGYSLEIDRAVFKLVKSYIEQKKDAIPVALNLSPSFFNHADAFSEFKELLSFVQKNSKQLCVEAPHISLIQHIDMCQQIAESVKQTGQQFGIDQIDLDGDFQVLQKILPAYVKVNAKMLGDLSDSMILAAYKALRNLTATLDIQLIVVGIDEQELYDRLIQLNIDAAQGHLLGQPEENV